MFQAFVLLAVLAGVFGGAWVYSHRQTIAWQWASYQVGTAATFEQAREQFAWFEQGPHAPEKLRVLVGKWGTSNPTFDRYLAEYATAGASSGALRQAFAEELARRPELLPRWAHFWSWQASLEPDRQIESILEYLDALAFDEGPAAGPRLTWRELLDLQAIFVLTNDVHRAARVTPDNWREHYRVWTETQRTKLRHVPRPADPLPVTVHGAARAVFSAVREGDSPIFAAETVNHWAKSPCVPGKLGQSPRERLPLPD